MRKLRLAIVLMVVAPLLWFTLDALEREIQKAEERAANMVISQLQAALMIRGAEAMLNRAERLEDLTGSNPFGWLRHQWHNYQGLCQDGGPKPGDWCFRAEQQKETVLRVKGWLIYNPNQPITVAGRRALGAAPLAWRVATDFVDRNGNGRRENSERLTGLILVPVSLEGDAHPGSNRVVSETYKGSKAEI
ncbi:hypothetical protein LPB19_06490 [Marinobacter salinisoli]|uniref:Uncharacterized protein n=2 Tax=Marinobacter salinisoli TaxID=2769486 RepID=A0ABX7MZF5_9GAMM|nr:hypothetical protein LPB19_06490 [Marinobacter salinisoli]